MRTAQLPDGGTEKVRPEIMAPHGRIDLEVPTDNLNGGQEAATRSANRVANEIELA